MRAADTEAMAVIQLIETLREDVRFRCPIIVMAECAPGIEASNIERMIRLANLSNVCVMTEAAGGKEGVPKTARSTEFMLYELQREMLPGPGGAARLCYWDSLITWEIADVPKERWAHKVKRKMREQMNNLRKVYPKKQPEHGDSKFKITAKINGTSDDLLVALQMAVYWRTIFWNDVDGKYAAVKDRINSVVYHSF